MLKTVGRKFLNHGMDKQEVLKEYPGKPHGLLPI
jgi:hypothetical protein